MDKKEIKRTWTKLLLPFLVGVILCCVALYSICLGESDKMKVQGVFIGLFASLLCYFSGKKIRLFQKFLKDQDPPNV